MNKRKRSAKRRRFNRNTFPAPRRQIFPRPRFSNTMFENKTLTTTPFNVSVDAPGAFLLMNAISSGSTIDQRDGIHITMTSLYLHWYLTKQPNSTVTGVPVYIRFIIIYDQSPNLVSPTLTTIFTSDPAFDPTPLSMIKTEFSSRFLTVGKSKIVAIGDNQATHGPLGVSGEMYLKMELPVQFSGSGGTIANIAKGALYLCVLSQYHTFPITTALELGISTRLNFLDTKTTRVITHKGKGSIKTYSLLVAD